jgi:predicted RNase H-like HicB family nuclease
MHCWGFCCYFARICYISGMRAQNKQHFTAVIERDESGYYVGTVHALPSCYTQAKTLAQLYARLQEAITSSVRAQQDLSPKKVYTSTFIGVQQIELA